MERVEVVVERLHELGADRIDHPGGTLLRHLRGAHDALLGLGAPEAHRLAALCHAVYGTDGFDHHLLDPADRRQLRSLIGERAEGLVDLYARSDQDLFTRTAGPDHQAVPDRHDGSRIPVDEEAFAGLLAVWLGNELDLLEHADPSWALDGGTHVRAMFERNQHWLPQGGIDALARAVASARSDAASRRGSS